MRIVIDTNQLVAALVRPPELATLIMAWESARFRVVASPALLEEYQRVLAYPEVAALVYPELMRTFREHLINDIELVTPPDTPRLCRDPDDDKVIAAAYFGLVDYLLTVDQDLLDQPVVDVLRGYGIEILTATELIRRLDDRWYAAA